MSDENSGYVTPAFHRRQNKDAAARCGDLEGPCGDEKTRSSLATLTSPGGGYEQIRSYPHEFTAMPRRHEEYTCRKGIPGYSLFMDLFMTVLVRSTP